MKPNNIKLLMIAFCFMTSMNAMAADVITVGYLKYKLNGNEATVSGYDKDNLPADVTIPDEITYNGLKFTVTAIGENAFGNEFGGCSTIKTLKASKNIKKVGTSVTEDSSFENCKNLETASLPGVEYIYRKSFRGCKKLRYIELGNNLKYIDEEAFLGCSSLEYIVIPPTLTGAYHYCFYDCSSLQTIISLGDDCKVKPGYGGVPSSTKLYYVKDLVSWTSNSFTYTGKRPTPTCQTDLPAGFKLKQEIKLPTLEKNVGDYTVTVKATFANDDMSFDADIPYTYHITPVTLTARVKDAQRVYGDKDPKFESTYSGFVNGETESVIKSHGSYSTSAYSGSNVGTYSIRQSGASATNYTFKYEDGTLTVNKAPLTMTAADKTMTYGSKVPTLNATYTGLKNNESQPAWNTRPEFSTKATSTSKVGKYAITISGADAKNYNLTVSNGTLTIEKASLEIRADNKTKQYKDSNPELTYTCVGFVNGENTSALTTKPTVKTTATTNSAAGNYPIEISGAKSGNYAFTYKKGQLTINKRKLTVSTDDYTRAYGEENPTFQLHYDGFADGENASVLVKKPKATTSATKTSNVGTYTITIGSGVAENYDFNYKSGKLTIEKAYQTLTWNQDLSDVKQYDQVELTAKASSGLDVKYTIEGDNICSITKIGKKQYLDCKGIGEVVIIATQDGDRNYWQSTKVYKTVNISSPSGIQEIKSDLDKDVRIYDVNGNRIPALRKGINIIKYPDGRTRKISVK